MTLYLGKRGGYREFKYDPAWIFYAPGIRLNAAMIESLPATNECALCHP